MGHCMSTAARKVSNGTLSGNGGELLVTYGRKVVLITALDYKPSAYGGNAPYGGLLAELTSTTDGRNFAKLAKACEDVEVIEMYDGNVPGSIGHPDKATVIQKIKQLASELTPDDSFIFFFGGHGKQSDDSDKMDDTKENDTELCFCDQSGQYTPITDNEIHDILMNDFDPYTQVLMVTDCCQSGTVCDLSDVEFGDRPICHVAAVKDSQFAIDWGAGGGFTTCMVEAIEDLAKEGTEEFSIVELYNAAMTKFRAACVKFGDNPEEQTFAFERTPDSDPDCFMWPLVPPQGWSVNTMLDKGLIIGK